MSRRGSLGTPALAILLATLAACGGNSPTATTAQQATTGAAPATGRTATAATTARTGTPPAATPTRATATATRAGTTAPAATATRGTATAARAGTATATRAGTATGPWGPTLAPLTDGQEYRDPEGRFSLRVPQGWTEVTPDSPTIEVAFAGDDAATNVNVALSPVPGTVDLEAYNRSVETLLEQRIPEYRAISVDRVTIAGQRAYKRIWQTTSSGQRIQVQQVYFIAQGTAHVLSSGAPADEFAQYAETFDAIAGSYNPSP